MDWGRNCSCFNICISDKQLDYIMNVVIPESRKYGDLQKRKADCIIDGNKTKKEIINEIEDYIKKWHT